MKRNLFLLCLLCLIATDRLSAQTQTDTDRYSLYGQIKDTDGSPVELANIALLSAADSTYLQGTCSRADGTFTLPGTPPGRYLLQVSCIGYETQLLPSDGITAVVCILPPASYTLQEAGVTVSCDEIVDHIINRDHTGWCPLEQASRDLQSAKEIFPVIEKFISSQRKNI